ncbi:DNRLRE domain-containing protein [Paenibacillus oenotherae]|uniref:DNRLRE domain-containing protein n=1 Tax=Paenibacillus oenotherae TaxID=1435645 RepID=A0ABS7D7E2_9BACL|nr:DNRLRE domain-containing protein [Paenibacillus oenotherae]MBW7475810.1 DNRLRE domain-containing protein [Paenibacillus oenotherae]
MKKSRIIRMLLIIVCLMLLLPSIAIGKSKDNAAATIEMKPDNGTGELNTDDSRLEKDAEPKVVKEMTEKRTFNTKHFLMDDGTMRAEIHQGNLHFQDETHNWQEINTALIDEADIDITAMKVSKDIAKEAREITNNNKAKVKKGVDRSQTNFRSIKVPFDTVIPKDYSKGYSIAKGTDKLTFKPVNANKSIGTIDSGAKNRIHYKNVWSYTDVELIVTNQGVKEYIYLLNDKAPKKFSFEINAKLKNNLQQGDLIIEPLWMEDSKGNVRNIQPTIAMEGKKHMFHIEVDTDGMSYPITVDPSVWVYSYGSGGGAAGVSSYSPDMSFPTILRVGERTSGSTKDIYLAYYKFPLGHIPENTQITSVVLAAKMSSLDIQPEAYLDIIPYEVEGSLNVQNLTYNNRPSHTTTNSGGSLRVSRNRVPMTTDYLYWDVTAMTKSNFENTSTLHANKSVSMVLYPVSSGGNGALKHVQFDGSSPPINKLIINYRTSTVNSPPTVSFSKNDIVMYLNRRTKICWNYKDLNGDDQVKYRMSGIRYDGSSAYHSGVNYLSGSYGSSYCHYLNSALSTGMWEFKVSAFDGIDWSNEIVRDVVIDHVDAPNTHSNVPMNEINKVYYGGFDTGDTVDFFKFTASSTGGNHLSLKNLTSQYNPTEINVVILDENNQVVVPASNTIKHGISLEIDFNSVEGKIYYIRISNVAANFGGPYKWAVTPTQHSFLKNQYSYIYDSLGRLQFISYYWGFYYMRTEYIYDLNGNIIKRISTQTERK